jgi:toxin ParE1/3/4
MFIRWTTAAADDFAHVCDYTEQRFGPAQARYAALTIYENIDLLKATPHKGRRGRRHGTRELRVPKMPFVVVYRVQEGVIEISRILHGAQRWP